MRLPMFPLGTVLFPYALLPLHVFEPRYRRMLDDLRDVAPPEFGVVLIERGSEVGGGDLRTSWGTIARVVRAVELPDGRWQVVAVGTRRFRVREWLPDDPYPVADVDEVDDVDASGPAEAGAVDAAAVEQRLRAVLALRAELGDPAPPVAEIDLDVEDVATASWQIASLAGLSPLDGQALLQAPHAPRRLELLAGMLGDQLELLRFRLSP